MFEHTLTKILTIQKSASDFFSKPHVVVCHNTKQNF